MKHKFFLSLVFVFVLFSTANTASAVVLPSSVAATEPDPAKVKAATEEFKSLSKKERKDRIKTAKKEIKAYKTAKKSGQDPDTNTLLLVILAILLPPLAVYLHEGEINNRFWISLLLTLLFWLPGVIYALVIILGDN